MHPLRKIRLPDIKNEIKDLIPTKVLLKNHRIALEEGNKVFDFANSPGFAILLRDIKQKIDQLKSSWLKAPDKEQAEIFRIKGQVWDEVIVMCGRYLQNREVAEKALRNKKKIYSPQGEVTSDQG